MQNICLEKCVAMPRLHRIFNKDKVLILDPLGNDIENVYQATPTFTWQKDLAMQCLYDFQQNAKELAKDKQGAVQSLDIYFLQKANNDLTQDELTAIKEFAGIEDEKENLSFLEKAQRLLILAYYKEEQYQELQEVQKRFSEQQNILKNLLDDEQIQIDLTKANIEYLPKWKQVFPAFLAFTKEPCVYYINDKEMADFFYEKVNAVFNYVEIEHKNYFYGIVNQSYFSAYLPDELKNQKKEIAMIFPCELIRG